MSAVTISIHIANIHNPCVPLVMSDPAHIQGFGLSTICGMTHAEDEVWPGGRDPAHVASTDLMCIHAKI